MTNAVVWNTLYMQETLLQMNGKGNSFIDERLEHLSPARFEHVNRYGRYRFDVERKIGRTGLRPLRQV